MILLMQTTHPEPTSLSNISQSQLVILRYVTKTKRQHNLQSKIHSNAKQWKLLNARTKIRSTTRRACATTVIINTEETVTPMHVLTLIGSYMPKESVRIAILMTITSSKED